MNTCKSCGALIRWVRTERGKMMPLDAQPNADGNIVLIDNVAYVFRPELIFHTLEQRWMTHWATCPQAKEWRRKNEAT